MTCKIYKKVLRVNSEEGKMKCVLYSGQAAVTLHLKGEVGVALEPGETVIIKYTHIYWEVTGHVTIYFTGVCSDPQPSCADPWGRISLKQKKVGEEKFQTRMPLVSDSFKSKSQCKGILKQYLQKRSIKGIVEQLVFKICQQELSISKQNSDKFLQ